jgi:acetylornithine deacetylase/succinyl-diaminopimelate desuccinylase-like protein
MAAIHSPTGAEAPLAQFLVDHLRQAGTEARLQEIDAASANLHATLRGSGGGPSVLLYAPIDTHLEADPAQDIPWVGPELRRDMRPIDPALPLSGDPEELVIGLGAANPKGMAASLAEAFIALHEAGVPLKGDLTLAFAGGGMPSNATHRGNRGLGDGVYHLISRGVTADFAIVMKPYNQVYHEEPGLCWFKVSVRGALGYAGIPHGRPGFESSIVPAAKVVLALEEWLQRYATANSSGQVSTQGWISAVRAGWPDKPAFPSATTEILLDLRCSPRTSPAEVRAQFGAAIEEIRRADPALKLDWEMLAAYPGASTDPDNWIIRSAIGAWEKVEGKKHEAVIPRGGQTDISLIRNLQIPTARIGWASPPPNQPAEFAEGLGGMGVAYVPDFVVACRKVIHMVVDTCTRTRAEVGLGRN